MMKELEKILEKDPIIATAKARDIINNPAHIEDYYSTQAVTHMPIGKTDDYLQKINRYYSKNKGTFIGGVWADYGLGKTSLLIYYWYKAKKDNILAIPPYAWDDFEDNLHVAYHWCKYKLIDENKKLLEDIEELYETYRTNSIEDEIEKTKKELDINFEKAEKYVKERVESGRLKLSLTGNELLNFYEELAKIIKKGKYEGLLIFMDELQQTVDSSKLTFREMAGHLFDLADGLLSKNGDYGIFFGMPYSFHARLRETRSDVTDRIDGRDCFINLGEMYSKDFAEKLWNKYVDKFNLNEVENEVVKYETLISIGHICDSTRRDLGNGPRSVISTFNMMVSYYKENNSPYTPFDFIENCLDGEIKLGDKSTLVERINDLLSEDYVKNNYEFEKVIKFLSAFPQGTTKDIEKEFEIRDSIQKFIQQTGGLGNEISPNVRGGHILNKLKPPRKDQPMDDKLTQQLSYFYQNYAIDKEGLEIIKKSFIETILNELFPKRTKAKLQGWRYLDDWQERDNIYINKIKGTFENSRKYPNRNIKLEILLSEDEEKLRGFDHYDFYYKNAKDPLDFVFRFILNSMAKEDEDKGKIEIDNDYRIINFYINPFYYKDNVNIPNIVENVIEKRDQIPFMFLNLLDYMDEIDLQSDDADNWKYCKDQIINAVIKNLFNDGLLDVRGTDIELDNMGKLVIQDLYYYICKKVFPEYETIMLSSSWDKKVNQYVSVLSRNDIPLNVKRGNKPLEYKDEAPPQKSSKKFSKTKIAELFGLKKYSTFENWIDDLGPLVDAENFDMGEIYLQKHPVEEEIVDRIEKSDRKEMFKGEECSYIDGKEFLNKIMTKGYRYDEIKTIIKDIGTSRKLYDFKPGRKHIKIYKRPVSIEDKKNKLEKNLKKLSEDREKLSNEIPGFEKKPIRKIRSRVENSQNEEEIEEAQNELDNRRSFINNFVENYLDKEFSELKNKSNRLSNEFNPDKGKIKRILNSEFTSAASWREEIENIKGQLKKQRFDINRDITELKRDTEKLSNKILNYKEKYGDKNIDVFINIRNQIKDQLKKAKDQIEPEVQLYNSHINYLESFLKIDGLYEKAFEKSTTIEQNLNDEKIKMKYKELSDELRDKLKEKGKSYLKRHENEKEKIENLMKEAQSKIKRFRKEFLEQKEFLKEKIRKLDSSVSPIRTNFSAENVEESYRSLGEEANEKFENIINNRIEKLKELNTEIDYSKNILELEDEISNNKMEEKVKKLEEHLEGITEKINPDILSDTEDESREQIEKVIKELDDGLDIYRELITDIRKLQRPKKVDTQSKKMLNLISQGEKENLKEIILILSQQEKEIELEEILDMLKKCFKKNQINIIVEKGKQ